MNDEEKAKLILSESMRLWCVISIEIHGIGQFSQSNPNITMTIHIDDTDFSALVASSDQPKHE